MGATKRSLSWAAFRCLLGIFMTRVRGRISATHLKALSDRRTEVRYLALWGLLRPTKDAARAIPALRAVLVGESSILRIRALEAVAAHGTVFGELIVEIEALLERSPGVESEESVEVHAAYDAVGALGGAALVAVPRIFRLLSGRMNPMTGVRGKATLAAIADRIKNGPDVPAADLLEHCERIWQILAAPEQKARRWAATLLEGIFPALLKESVRDEVISRYRSEASLLVFTERDAEVLKSLGRIIKCFEEG